MQKVIHHPANDSTSRTTGVAQRGWDAMKKGAIGFVAAATLAAAMVTAPAPAEARGGRIAAGIIGGLAAGAIIGGVLGPHYYHGRHYYGPRHYYPAYYGPSYRRCYRERRWIWTPHGQRLRWIRTCY